MSSFCVEPGFLSHFKLKIAEDDVDCISTDEDDIQYVFCQTLALHMTIKRDNIYMTGKHNDMEIP